MESMDRPRAKHTATLLLDGRVMVVGGTTDGTTPLASVEQFDPETNRWTSGGTIKEARWGHSTILLTDGQALVVGGYGFATLRSAEIYRPAGGGWHSGDSLARWMGNGGDGHPRPWVPAFSGTTEGDAGTTGGARWIVERRASSRVPAFAGMTVGT